MLLSTMRSGRDAAALVNPLYEKNGSTSRAREGDQFFLILHEGECVACVRYCVEEGTSLLRSMLVDEKHRRQGMGQKLLGEFVVYLDQNQIRDVFCIPYAHLESFYGKAGFQRIEATEIPTFLAKRMENYSLKGQAQGKTFLCMRRP